MLGRGLGSTATVEVLYVHETPDGGEYEVTYKVTIDWDSAPDYRPCWHLYGIEPQPPSREVEEKLFEDACVKVDEAQREAAEDAEWPTW
jgi:hypothetical protein